jgi:hypothetical protein
MSGPLAKPPALPTASIPRGLFSRNRFYLFAGMPMVLLMFAGGAHWLRLPGSDPRLVTSDFRQLETRLERRLYAPTSMPAGLNLMPDRSPTTGAHRVMQAYVTQNAELGLILAQEPRNPERDAYHRRLFKTRAERKVDLNGKRGYIITGHTGERRLYWEEEATSLILSSARLPDETLVAVALTVSLGPKP